MVVTISKYIHNVAQIYKEQPAYEYGHNGSDGKCDCIGMVKGALERSGSGSSGLSGTNYAARNTIRELKRITSERDLSVGMVVLKARDPGDDGYDLPEKYRKGGPQYNGDLQDYYHIGTVTRTNPLEITHMTSPSAKIDTKLGKWKYYGKLPQVDYADKADEKQEVTVVIEYKKVVGGNLNMRSQPSKESSIITKIPNNANVAVTEHVNSEWSKVVYNAYTGYAMSQYLSDNEQDDGDKISISLSKTNATELYEALKSALNK